MNKTFVFGRLTADPTTREANGNRVTSFTVASDTRSKDAEGNNITNFFRVSVWGTPGDNCAKWLHKGSRVIVYGEVVMRSYTDKNNQLRYSLDIPKADTVEFVETKADNANAPSTPAAPPSPSPSVVANYASESEDEIPF